MTNDPLKEASARIDRWLMTIAILILLIGLIGRYSHCQPISASRESCQGTKCRVVYEGVEGVSAPCYVTLWCNGATPCYVTQTWYAGRNRGKSVTTTIQPGGAASWSGVYPRETRAYVQPGGVLRWRIEAEGVRAWEAWETAGEMVNGHYVWPLKRLLRPAKVDVGP